MRKSDSIPIVYARRVAGRETDLLIVRCVYCGKEHQHGVGGRNRPIGYGDGHRVAECFNGDYDVRERRHPKRRRTRAAA
jgi:hypothetical protein